VFLGTPKQTRQRCLVAAAQGFALVLACATANAEEPTILWSAPMECPGQAALRERISGALGAPLSSFETDVVFDARVEHQPDGYHAVLTSHGRDDLGGRELVNRSCDKVASDVAWVVALALRAVAKQLPETAPGAANPDQSASGQGAPDAATAESIRELEQMRTPEARSRYSVLTWHATLLAGADVGSLPGPTPEVSVGVGLWTRRFSVTLRGLILAPNSTDTAQFALIGGDVDACYRPHATTHTFVGTCAAIELGNYSGKGKLATWAEQDSFWFAPGLRLTGGFRLGRSLAWLVGGIGGLVPVSRPQFVWRNNEVIHQPGALVGRIDLGVLVEFR
jgi:hypothetical protein